MKESIPETSDDEFYNFMLYDFVMNYSLENMRQGYGDILEKRNNKIDNELLRKLGYSEEDIAKNTVE